MQRPPKEYVDPKVAHLVGRYNKSKVIQEHTYLQPTKAFQAIVRLTQQQFHRTVSLGSEATSLEAVIQTRFSKLAAAREKQREEWAAAQPQVHVVAPFTVPPEVKRPQTDPQVRAAVEAAELARFEAAKLRQVGMEVVQHRRLQLEDFASTYVARLLSVGVDVASGHDPYETAPGHPKTRPSVVTMADVELERAFAAAAGSGGTGGRTSKLRARPPSSNVRQHERAKKKMTRGRLRRLTVGAPRRKGDLKVNKMAASGTTIAGTQCRPGRTRGPSLAMPPAGGGKYDPVPSSSSRESVGSRGGKRRAAPERNQPSPLDMMQAEMEATGSGHYRVSVSAGNVDSPPGPIIAGYVDSRASGRGGQSGGLAVETARRSPSPSMGEWTPRESPETPREVRADSPEDRPVPPTAHHHFIDVELN